LQYHNERDVIFDDNIGLNGIHNTMKAIPVDHR